METLEQLLALFVAAVVLASLARRVGAPYPVFLALGGAAIALMPQAPTFALPPELALALFVAPVLVDAAYDMSLRDLRDNWAPIAGLVVAAVGLTTAAVAAVAHALVPDLPWAAAIALGAIVAPPDAVAAGAVLRPMHPPHRIVNILEGESLLNDATALLVYRLAVGAVAAGEFTWGAVGPAFLLGVAGSLLAGALLGRAVVYVTGHIEHVPTAIILQFVFSFGVWITAERLGLSAVLTMVCFAVTVKRTRRRPAAARMRIATNAVWSAVVFALNILAFIFIGLQVRPILEGLDQAALLLYLGVAGAVLATAIGVRVGWHMSFNAALRWRHRRWGYHPPRPLMRPTVGTGLVISWAGMRGIVTLAAALALPAAFPQRDLILFTAFGVVLGTLVVQGLTLKPLLRMLRLRDDDPVGRETAAARERAYQAGLDSLAGLQSPDADKVRDKLRTLLVAANPQDGAADGAARQRVLYQQALDAARETIHAMRDEDEIGDNAFLQIEQDLDWREMAIGGDAPAGTRKAAPRADGLAGGHAGHAAPPG
jgi:CPA1 family monovalent cation:H+ antiporter